MTIFASFFFSSRWNGLIFNKWDKIKDAFKTLGKTCNDEQCSIQGVARGQQWNVPPGTL